VHRPEKLTSVQINSLRNRFNNNFYRLGRGEHDRLANGFYCATYASFHCRPPAHSSSSIVCAQVAVVFVVAIIIAKLIFQMENERESVGCVFCRRALRNRTPAKRTYAHPPRGFSTGSNMFASIYYTRLSSSDNHVRRDFPKENEFFWSLIFKTFLFFYPRHDYINYHTS